MYKIDKHLVGSIESYYKTGYYKIYHLAKPNMVYIGSTFTKRVIGNKTGFLIRLGTHFSNLLYNKHINKKLQNVVNKYGIEELRFEIVEVSSDWNSRVDRERYWINYFDSYTNGYNLTSDTSFYIPTMTEESKKRMAEKVSQKHKGKIPKNLEYMRKSRWKPILEFENGILVREYESTAEAGRLLEINYKCINNFLRGKSKTIIKYPNKTWEYKDERNK